MEPDNGQNLFNAVRKTSSYDAILDPIREVEDQSYHSGVFTHGRLADAPKEAVLKNHQD